MNHVKVKVAKMQRFAINVRVKRLLLSWLNKDLTATLKANKFVISVKVKVIS